MTATHEELVTRARGGDRAALDSLVRDMKDLVYNLAARMLGDPIEAEDATQEILIRCVTALESFRGESAFRTWVYRVASNHLLTARGKRARQATESFDEGFEELGRYVVVVSLERPSGHPVGGGERVQLVVRQVTHQV